MKRLLMILATLCTVAVPNSHAKAGVVIVANLTDQSSTNLRLAEIRNVFMGGLIPNRQLQPVVLSPGVRVRSVFNAHVVGLTESRIQSYWAQMQFSGRKKRPVEVDTVEAMLHYLLKHENSIGYLPEDTTIPAGLTVFHATQ